MIPDPNHVARYCKPITVVNGRIQASAFHLRHGENNLSVNWLELFHCTSRLDELQALRAAYITKGLVAKEKGKIAVLNAGVSRNNVLNHTSDRRDITFHHDPAPLDPSHSSIQGMRPNEVLIAELIRQTIQEIHSTRI